MSEFDRGVLSRAEWTDALHATYFAVFRTQAPESMKACDISHAIVDAITDARDAVGDPLFQRLLATHAQEQGELKAKIAELEAALVMHRADLHEWSRRPCPTCLQSSKALGIDKLVPHTCARMESDKQAFAKLREGK